MQKILLIDNYDSFVYNLYQYIGELGADIEVRRNDAAGIDDIKKLNPDKIIISPGPGRPEKAGVSVSLIKEFYDKIPILGVCLGHQAIGYAFGAKIIRADKIMHGKTSIIYHNARFIFRGLSNPFIAARYHSLIVDNKTLPDRLQVCAKTDNNQIMGIQVSRTKTFGIQFHPESILTKEGKLLLDNFLHI